MPESPLYSLYRVHQVDAALNDMKKRAAALDGGKAILAQIAAIKEQHAAEVEGPTKIADELKDLEAKNSIHRAKVKDLEKQLYGGSVVNSKEAAGYEQEIAHLKALVDTNETRMMELMEASADADEAAKPFQQQIDKLTQALNAKKVSDQKEAVQLQADYKAKSAERVPLAAEVPKPLLTQYDIIRQKYGGIGMGIVAGKACGACGTQLPTKIIETLDFDRLVTCESCHRILIKLVPGS